MAQREPLYSRLITIVFPSHDVCIEVAMCTRLIVCRLITLDMKMINIISKLVESIVQTFVLMLNSFSSFRHYCAIALPVFKQLVCYMYTTYITILLIVDSDDDVIVTGVNKVKEDPDAVIFVASSKVKRNRKGNTALLLSVPSKGNRIQTVMHF